VEKVVLGALRSGFGWPGGGADGHGPRLAGWADRSPAEPRRSIRGRVGACLSGPVEDKTTHPAAGTRHESGARQRFVRGGGSRPRSAGVWPVLSRRVNPFQAGRVRQEEGGERPGSAVTSRGPAVRVGSCQVPKTGRAEAPCGTRTFLCAALERVWTILSGFAKQQIVDCDRVGRPCAGRAGAAAAEDSRNVSAPPQPRARKETEVDMNTLLIVGPGCGKCHTLAQRTEEAARELGLAYELRKITDLQQIMALGVMMTPALVVNGAVKVSGRVPTVEELKQILRESAVQAA